MEHWVVITRRREAQHRLAGGVGPPGVFPGRLGGEFASPKDRRQSVGDLVGKRSCKECGVARIEHAASPAQSATS